MSATDTIFALTTPRGRSGVAVVRVSGRLAFDAAVEMSGPLGPARSANLREIKDPESASVLDEAIVLHFEEGQSFTGEKIVEFQTHGSLAVVDALLKVLGQREGFRLAHPGEFTKRALLNDRMDLSQVEGLSDLIEAETEAQLKQSLLIMQGELSEKTSEWRSKLLKIMGNMEASIDFDDEDVPDDLLRSLSSEIKEVIASLNREMSGSEAARLIKAGFKIAIVGKPNAGKSTLLNALAGKDAAITSEIAGTTRDVIEVRMDISGYPVTLMDTAGLRDSEDEIEKLGVDLALLRAEEADLRIILAEQKLDLGDLKITPADRDLIVHSKSDLDREPFGISVSATAGLGIDDLISKVGDVLENSMSGASSMVRQRHIDALNDAISNLESAHREIEGGDFDVEICAESVRRSLRSLEVLIGKVDVEHVLGDIFSNFCIGK